MFSPGQEVSVLNESTRGKVLALLPGNQVRIETIEGLELDYPASELVLYHPHTHKLSRIPDNLYKEEKKREKNGFPDKPGMEVDLHIHALLDDWRHMSNGEIVQYQLRHLRMKMEAARKHKMTRMIIIHGRGEGVLKSEVRSLLAGMENVEFFDASYLEYGWGATEVKLWYK